MAAVLSASSLLVAGAAPGSVLDKPDYVGATQSKPRGKVAFRVIRKADQVTAVRFSATKIPVQCEDGSHLRTDLGLRTLKVRSNRFDATFHRPGFDEAVYRFRGRLHSNGSASGYLVAYFDPFDPDGGSSPECSTVGGRLHWRAHRVKTGGV